MNPARAAFIAEGHRQATQATERGQTRTRKNIRGREPPKRTQQGDVSEQAPARKKARDAGQLPAQAPQGSRATLRDRCEEKGYAMLNGDTVRSNGDCFYDTIAYGRSSHGTLGDWESQRPAASRTCRSEISQWLQDNPEWQVRLAHDMCPIRQTTCLKDETWQQFARRMGEPGVWAESPCLHTYAAAEL
jgi:hypothetical protein